MSKRSPWEMRVCEYIGDVKRPTNSLLGMVDDAATKDFQNILEDFASGRLSLDDSVPAVQLSPGYSRRAVLRHSTQRSGYVFVEDATQNVVGAPRVGMSSPYVLPAHRGRGIVSHDQFINEMAGKAGRTMGYTDYGIESRAATHRIHVEQALKRGDDVPEEVLADYVVDEAGKVSRSERYSFQRLYADFEGMRAGREDPRDDAVLEM